MSDGMDGGAWTSPPPSGGKAKISVAIDGPSGAGKSSVARAVAGKYNFVYVDTGAIYRTLALAALRVGVDAKDQAGVAALLPSVEIDVTYSPWMEQIMLLDGQDVSGEIRTPEISRFASDISAYPEVRAFLLGMQREMAEKHDVVMDGRDIGTVVLPGADVKIFLTASAAVRAERRRRELAERGQEISFEAVLREMEYRDRQDETRADAPLRQAQDAVLVDTTDMDFLESVAAVCQQIFLKTGR